MSTEKLDKLAKEFEILASGNDLTALANKLEAKLAAYAAKEKAEMPEACEPDDLTWLDERERGLIKINGKDKEYWPHNPPASIASEKTWDRAKKIVKKYWSRYSDPWAVVFDLYRKLGGKVKKSKKRK
jgi:hypothetical protein